MLQNKEPIVFQDSNDILDYKELAKQEIPTFRPTMAEFSDFEAYVASVEAEGYRAGLIKIVPPAEWKVALPDFSRLLISTFNPDTMSSLEQTGQFLLDNCKVVNPIEQHFKGDAGIYSLVNIESRRSLSLRNFYRVAQSMEPRPSKRSRSRLLLKDGMGDNISDFDARASLYWQSLKRTEALYGADVSGSLFPPDSKTWNVACLPGILQLMDEEILGVNTPFLYIGSYKSTFGWHVEVLEYSRSLLV